VLRVDVNQLHARVAADARVRTDLGAGAAALVTGVVRLPVVHDELLRERHLARALDPLLLLGLALARVARVAPIVVASEDLRVGTERADVTPRQLRTFSVPLGHAPPRCCW